MSKRDEQPFASVWGRHGMVSSCHPLASQVGMEMMTHGGNAVDATVAMAYATAVLMPDMCGLGGEAFSLIRRGDGAVRAFLGSGVLPKSFDLTALGPGLTLPLRGAKSVSVPGSVELYERIHRQYGHLPWRDVVQPAVRLAEDGFLCDRRLAESLIECQSFLEADAHVLRRFYPAGRPLAEGDLVLSKELAKTLKILQQDGASAFYEGDIAQAIVGAIESQDGYLSLSDMKNHRGEEADPLHIRWHGYDLYQTPLPTPGVVLLEALRLLEDDDFGPDWRESPELVHRVIEALRLAFQDRRNFLGDPWFGASRAEELLSDAWISQRRHLIGSDALDIPTHLQSGDTTSFVAVDDTGLSVSFIHSLALAFGSGVYVPEGGFFLNNRSGRSFNRIAGHPNEAVPGKRPMHTLNTYLVTKAGKTVLVGNTPGGDGQPQWNLSVLLDRLAGGRMPHEAVSLPRMTMTPATDVHTLQETTQVHIESRFSPVVIDELTRRGHRIDVIGPYASGGNVQLIAITDEGFVGASDPRELGQTQGY